LFRVGSEASFEGLYGGAIRNALQWRNSHSGAPADLAAQIWLATEEWKASVASRSGQFRDPVGDRLGPEYWRTLNEYRNLERSSFERSGASEDVTARLPRLRLRLAELEAVAEIRPFSTIFPENFSARKALSIFQDRLEPDTALIRYHLGKQEAVRWVLTRKGLDWKQLKISPKELESLATRFNQVVRAGSNGDEIRQSGRQLYDELFGDLPQEARTASHWMLALDGILFQIPLAALSEASSPNGPARYLVERHSLAIVTGAQVLLARPSEGNRAGEFVGIGDAIYNPADPRMGNASRPVPRAWGALFASEKSTADGQIHLPRLASSQLELRNAATAWSGPARLLLGHEANRQNAVRSIEAGASVVHFATHFLQNEESPDRALLVLSLDEQGHPDFFTPSDAVHVRTPESLVVLSGCQSAAGKLVPVAGLIGMARAWLMAGASGVVASFWPVPDDNGAIFQAFYSKLRRNEGPSINGDGDFNTRDSVRPRGGIVRKAAEALRYAQLEMLRTNSWRAMPKYWGTYQLLGRMM
jgi:CHAT domain-containing protein